MPDEEFVIYNGQRMTRENAAYLEEVQSLTHYCVDSKLYPRLPYGVETFRDPSEAGRNPCRHCGAVKGQLHEPLCDYEQCPVCSGQVMSCDCNIFVEDAVRAEPGAAADRPRDRRLLGLCRQFRVSQLLSWLFGQRTSTVN